jgi:hypothetical protein
VLVAFNAARVDEVVFTEVVLVVECVDEVLFAEVVVLVFNTAACIDVVLVEDVVLCLLADAAEEPKTTKNIKKRESNMLKKKTPDFQTRFSGGKRVSRRR